MADMRFLKKITAALLASALIVAAPGPGCYEAMAAVRARSQRGVRMRTSPAAPRAGLRRNSPARVSGLADVKNFQTRMKPAERPAVWRRVKEIFSVLPGVHGFLAKPSAGGAVSVPENFSAGKGGRIEGDLSSEDYWIEAAAFDGISPSTDLKGAAVMAPDATSAGIRPHFRPSAPSNLDFEIAPSPAPPAKPESAPSRIPSPLKSAMLAAGLVAVSAARAMASPSAAFGATGAFAMPQIAVEAGLLGFGTVLAWKLGLKIYRWKKRGELLPYQARENIRRLAAEGVIDPTWLGTENDGVVAGQELSGPLQLIPDEYRRFWKPFYYDREQRKFFIDPMVTLSPGELRRALEFGTVYLNHLNRGMPEPRGSLRDAMDALWEAFWPVEAYLYRWASNLWRKPTPVAPQAFSNALETALDRWSATLASNFPYRVGLYYMEDAQGQDAAPDNLSPAAKMSEEQTGIDFLSGHQARFESSVLPAGDILSALKSKENRRRFRMLRIKNSVRILENLMSPEIKSQAASAIVEVERYFQGKAARRLAQLRGVPDIPAETVDSKNPLDMERLERAQITQIWQAAEARYRLTGEMAFEWLDALYGSLKLGGIAAIDLPEGTDVQFLTRLFESWRSPQAGLFKIQAVRAGVEAPFLLLQKQEPHVEIKIKLPAPIQKSILWPRFNEEEAVEAKSELIRAGIEGGTVVPDTASGRSPFLEELLDKGAEIITVIEEKYGNHAFLSVPEVVAAQMQDRFRERGIPSTLFQYRVSSLMHISPQLHHFNPLRETGIDGGEISYAAALKAGWKIVSQMRGPDGKPLSLLRRLRQFFASLVYVLPRLSRTQISAGAVDTGRNPSHPMISHVEEVNLVNQKSDDPQLHGSHVISIIGGKAVSLFRKRWIQGFLPRAKATMAKVFADDESGARMSVIQSGVVALLQKGLQVVNLSLGSEGHPGSELAKFLGRVIEKAGVFVSVAAGNSGPQRQTVGSPAANPAVMAVASLTKGEKDHLGELSGFSSQGDVWDPVRGKYVSKPDITAVGGTIRGVRSWLKECFFYLKGEFEGVLAAGGSSRVKDLCDVVVKGARYVWMSGTSMASPMIAGIGGAIYQTVIYTLLWARGKDYGEARKFFSENAHQSIKYILMATAISMGLPHQGMGAGQAHAYHAAQLATKIFSEPKGYQAIRRYRDMEALSNAPFDGARAKAVEKVLEQVRSHPSWEKTPPPLKAIILDAAPKIMSFSKGAFGRPVLDNEEYGWLLAKTGVLELTPERARELEKVWRAAFEAEVKKVLPAFIETVLDQNEPWLNRAAAVFALGEFRTAAAVPALTQAGAAQDERLRQHALQALWKIESPESTDALQKIFKESSGQARLYAAAGLARRGHTEESLPVLLEFLKEYNPSKSKFTRWSVLWALRETVDEKISWGDPITLFLASIVSDPMERVNIRELALDALREKGLADADSLPDEAFVHAVQAASDDPVGRRIAAQVIRFYVQLVRLRPQAVIPRLRSSAAIRKAMLDFVEKYKELGKYPNDELGLLAQIFANIQKVPLRLSPDPAGIAGADSEISGLHLIVEAPPGKKSILSDAILLYGPDKTAASEGQAAWAMERVDFPLKEVRKLGGAVRAVLPGYITLSIPENKMTALNEVLEKSGFLARVPGLVFPIQDETEVVEPPAGAVLIRLGSKKDPTGSSDSSVWNEEVLGKKGGTEAVALERLAWALKKLDGVNADRQKNNLPELAATVSLDFGSAAPFSSESPLLEFLQRQRMSSRMILALPAPYLEAFFSRFNVEEIKKYPGLLIWLENIFAADDAKDPESLLENLKAMLQNKPAVIQESLRLYLRLLSLENQRSDQKWANFKAKRQLSWISGWVQRANRRGLIPSFAAALLSSSESAAGRDAGQQQIQIRQKNLDTWRLSLEERQILSVGPLLPDHSRLAPFAFNLGRGSRFAPSAGLEGILYALTQLDRDIRRLNQEADELESRHEGLEAARKRAESEDIDRALSGQMPQLFAYMIEELLQPLSSFSSWAGLVRSELKSLLDIKKNPHDLRRQLTAFLEKKVPELQQSHMKNNLSAWAREMQVYELPKTAKPLGAWSPEEIAALADQQDVNTFSIGSAMLRDVSAPFAPIDFGLVNPALGASQDLAAFTRRVRQASARVEKPLRVIMDLPLHHVSLDSAFLTESIGMIIHRKATAEELRRPPEGWAPILHPEQGPLLVRLSAMREGERLRHHPNAAQLDYSSLQTRRWALETVRHWISKFGIDGFRIENPELLLNGEFARNHGVQMPAREFWEELISELKMEYPGIAFLAQGNVHRGSLAAAGFDAVINQGDIALEDSGGLPYYSQIGWQTRLESGKAGEAGRAIDWQVFQHWQKGGIGEILALPAPVAGIHWMARLFPAAHWLTPAGDAALVERVEEIFKPVDGRKGDAVGKRLKRRLLNNFSQPERIQGQGDEAWAGYLLWPKNEAIMQDVALAVLTNPSDQPAPVRFRLPGEKTDFEMELAPGETRVHALKRTLSPLSHKVKWLQSKINQLKDMDNYTKIKWALAAVTMLSSWIFLPPIVAAHYQPVTGPLNFAANVIFLSFPAKQLWTNHQNIKSGNAHLLAGMDWFYVALPLLANAFLLPTLLLVAKTNPWFWINTLACTIGGITLQAAIFWQMYKAGALKKSLMAGVLGFVGWSTVLFYITHFLT